MYRQVHLQFFPDPKVRKLSVNGKLVFLYLILAPDSHLCGLYNISFAAGSDYTGLSSGQFMEALRELSTAQMIDFDLDCGSIWVVQMYRHQMRNNAIDIHVSRHLETVHSKRLVEEFRKSYKLAKGVPTSSRQGAKRDTLRETLPPTLSTPLKERIRRSIRIRISKEEEEEKKKSISIAEPAGPASQIPEWFKPFWDSWPPIRKRDKQLCIEICQRKQLQGIIPEIVVGVNRWKLSREWLEGFVPEPAKFLRRERWKEEPTEGSTSSAESAEDRWAKKHMGEKAFEEAKRKESEKNGSL